MKSKFSSIWRVTLALVLVASLGLVFATPAAADGSPVQVWVDDNWTGTPEGDPADGHVFGYDAFATITEGVGGVATGGMVIVHDGTYSESVTVDKSVTITNATGETPVVTGASAGFDVTVNYVAIYGFKITGCSPGIEVDAGLSGIMLLYNEIDIIPESDSYGIHVLGDTDGLTIYGNIIHNNPNGTTYAIYLDPGIYYDTNIAGNHLFGTNYGLVLKDVHGESDAKRVQVVDNCIYGTDVGIWLDSCEFIDVVHNIVTENSYGIILNTAAGGLLYGISIVSNYITNNLTGIMVGEVGSVASVNWGGNIDISNNTIAGNMGGFVVRAENVFTVDASNNWWGHATGPFDMIGSPPPGDINFGGLGNGTIVEGPPFAAPSYGGPASLVYAPWLTADPYNYPLVVDITTPVTSTGINLHQTFSVCATITNVSNEPVPNVEAQIILTDPCTYSEPGAILVPGETSTKPVGSIAPGGSQDVCWTLKCTGCGDVAITVTTTAGVCAPTKPDTVIVHQPAKLLVEVDAPEKVCVSCNDWDVTATITNLCGMTATNVVASIDWTAEGDASWVSGGATASPHQQTIDAIAPGESAQVVWTLHCEAGEAGGGKPLEISVDVTGTNACSVLDTKATVYQHDELMVVFQTPTTTYPLTTFSTLQEFPVTVTVYNCTTSGVSDIAVNINWANSDDVSYWDGIAWNRYMTIDTSPEWCYWSGTAWVSGGHAPVAQTINTLCTCCCEDVSWLLRCEGEGEVTLTVTATGGEKTGENSVTIHQELKAHLDGKQDDGDDPQRGFIMPTSDDTFGVCEDFVVMAKVVNTGTAAALNVSATLQLGTKISLVAGETATKTIPMILGGYYGTFVWKVHCDACGTEMIKVVNISGTDMNTGAPILAANIETPTSVCPHQLGLGVDIISPQTCTDFNVSDTFCVDAVVTNLGSPCSQLGLSQSENEAVTATLNIYGPAELVSGEQSTKTIGIIPVGGTQEVEWTVRCSGRGDVKFAVTANVPAGCPYAYSRTSDLVIVHQQKVCPPPELVIQYPVGLAQGWNLISLPLIPVDPTIETVLDGVVVQKVAAYSPFQDWKYYTPGAPSDLTQMNDGWGYWVDMGTEATTLIVSGYELVGPPPAVPPYYDVVEGWNLIGFKSTMPKAAAVYLAGITGKYVVIYGFANGRYFLVGSSDILRPGLGYWIAITAPGTIYP